MKRALLGTLWIGSVAAAVALTLSLSKLLVHPAGILDKALRLSPNDAISFGNCLLVVALSLALAWIMIELSSFPRRLAILFLVIAELIGAAWVSGRAGFSFSPWPAIIGVIVATVLGLITSVAGRLGQQRRLAQRLFGDRLGQSEHDRLTEGKIDFSQPVARTASFVFCGIGNESDLTDELSPTGCAQLTLDFIELARKYFLQAGGYLHAADGEGIRILFGFPNESAGHALEAGRAALG